MGGAGCQTVTWLGPTVCHGKLGCKRNLKLTASTENMDPKLVLKDWGSYAVVGFVIKDLAAWQQAGAQQTAKQQNKRWLVPPGATE